MDNPSENQIRPLLCAAVLLIVPSLACSWFFIPGLSPLLLTLTFSVLVLSTVSIIAFTNRRSITQGENAKQEIENAVESMEDFGSESTEPESVTSESATSDDCSMSDDEDGLIEIALPCQQCAYSSKEEQKQQGPEELLAEIHHEVNEEENLIEIDISIGSIKCSRFEIEAKISRN